VGCTDGQTIALRWCSALIAKVVLSCVVHLSAHAAQVPIPGPGKQDHSASMLNHVTSTLNLGGAQLQVVFTGTTPDLAIQSLVEHIRQAGQAVAGYYGRFPVHTARILIVVEQGKHGVLQGTTWGDIDGFPAVTRLRIGQHTTATELDEDWVTTHEMVHMALPSLPDSQHWLEEGLATYIEPIARSRLGQLTPEAVWAGILSGMPNGEPEEHDRGLDHTHTWGRTYWGGALFCLVADIELRKKTKNVYGLQDALRAVVNKGGTIDREWPIERVLAVADKATQTSVLEDLYKSWGSKPVAVDLAQLWEQLGVRLRGDRIIFDSTAPSAQIREDITGPKVAKRVP
jgi:hypothetical protein